MGKRPCWELIGIQCSKLNLGTTLKETCLYIKIKCNQQLWEQILPLPNKWVLVSPPDTRFQVRERLSKKCPAKLFPNSQTDTRRGGQGLLLFNTVKFQCDLLCSNSQPYSGLKNHGSFIPCKSLQQFKTVRLYLQGGAREGLQLEYAKHRVYSCIVVSYIIFHINKPKPPFAPPCTFAVVCRYLCK